MTEKATFAAGCFWHVEDDFMRLPGIISTQVGYTGGKFENPSYEDMHTGKTGHAESVEVEFDPSKITYDQLLNAFWNLHDPTQSNGQGPDLGNQYRSVIFYHSEAQKKAAEASKARLEGAKKFSRPIVTQIISAGKFWRAEEYHQKYYLKNGISGVCPR